jgi:hypothetical protein
LLMEKEVCFPWLGTINGNRQLLFQHTWPPMPASNQNLPK